MRDETSNNYAVDNGQLYPEMSSSTSAYQNIQHIKSTLCQLIWSSQIKRSRPINDFKGVKGSL